MGRVRRTSKKIRSKMSKNLRRMAKKVTNRRKPARKKPTKKKSSKKSKKGPTDWNMHLMKVYKEMKAKDSKVRFGDAMKAAKKTYKQAKSASSKWSVGSDEYSTVTQKKPKQDGGKSGRRTRRR